MVTVIKNYKVLDERLEEFQCIKIRDDEDVFYELPICLVDYNAKLAKPVLLPQGEGKLPKAVEYDWLASQLSMLKVFHLKPVENGKLIEVPESDAALHLRFPKDTNIGDLIFQNGQIVKLSQKEE